jgi:hypothetical protein
LDKADIAIMVALITLVITVVLAVGAIIIEVIPRLPAG